MDVQLQTGRIDTELLGSPLSQGKAFGRMQEGTGQWQKTNRSLLGLLPLGRRAGGSIDTFKHGRCVPSKLNWISSLKYVAFSLIAMQKYLELGYQLKDEPPN